MGNMPERLELTDPGFDFSLRIASFAHAGFRGKQKRNCCTPYLTCVRVVAGGTARGRQRTSTTHVLAAIREPPSPRVRGRNTAPDAECCWQRWPQTGCWRRLDAEWFDRSSRRFDEYRFPKAQSERLELAETIGTDGHQLLTAVYAPTAPAWLAELPAVET
jgi:transposase